MKNTFSQIVLYILIIITCISCNTELDVTNKVLNGYADIYRSSDYSIYPESDVSKVSAELADSNNYYSTTTPLCLEANNIVLALNNPRIVCVSFSTLQWKVDIDGVVNNASMVADKEHNIYCISNKGTVYSITKSGKVRWKRSVSNENVQSFNSDALCLDNGVIVANGNGTIKKFDFNGNMMWEYFSYRTPSHTFAADNNNNLMYVAHDSNINGSDSLCMIGEDGKLKWQVEISQTTVSCNVSWVGDFIYVGGERIISNNKIPIIHCYNNAGQIVWSRQIPVTPRGISIGLADSLLYVVGFNAQIQHEVKSEVLALQKNSGHTEWELWYDYAINHPVLITTNYLHFIGTQNKATGFFRMNKNGTLHSLVSLSNSEEVYPIPAIAPNGMFIFGSTQHTGIVTLSGSLLGFL